MTRMAMPPCNITLAEGEGKGENLMDRVLRAEDRHLKRHASNDYRRGMFWKDS